jgi:hypothetical protein
VNSKKSTARRGAQLSLGLFGWEKIEETIGIPQSSLRNIGPVLFSLLHPLLEKNISMSRVRRGQFHEGFCSVYAPQSRLNIIPATRRPKSGHMNNQQPLSLFLLWGVMFFWGGGVVESPYITDHNDISVLLEIGHSRNCNTNSSQTKKKVAPLRQKMCGCSKQTGQKQCWKRQGQMMSSSMPPTCHCNGYDG